VISINDYKKIEEGVRFVLKSEYWGATDGEIDDQTINPLRIYLRDRNVKIEGYDPLNIEPSFPVAVIVSKKISPPKLCRLSEEDVHYLRAHREMTAIALGKMFNVSDSTIAKVRHGLSHVDIVEEDAPHDHDLA
jgi:hypothetical protein